MKKIKQFKPQEKRWTKLNNKFMPLSKEGKILPLRYRTYISLELRPELKTTPEIQEAICDYILYDFQQSFTDQGLDILLLTSIEEEPNHPIIHMTIEHTNYLSLPSITNEIEKLDFIIPTMLVSRHRISNADNVRPLFIKSEVTIISENHDPMTFTFMQDSLRNSIYYEDHKLNYFYDHRQHYFNLVKPIPTKPHTSNQLNIFNTLKQSLIRYEYSLHNNLPTDQSNAAKDIQKELRKSFQTN